MLAAAVFVTACGGSSPPARQATPPYDADYATLFSDLFRPELFGIESSKPAELDGLLSERARKAEAVLPIRVITLSREIRGGTRSYSVVVEQTGPGLAGNSLHAPLALAIPERSPAFGWLEGAGTAWVGTHVLLMFRTFQDGPHFFGTSDTPAVRAAIAEALRNAPVPAAPKPRNASALRRGEGHGLRTNQSG